MSGLEPSSTAGVCGVVSLAVLLGRLHGSLWRRRLLSGTALAAATVLAGWWFGLEGITVAVLAASVVNALVALGLGPGNVFDDGATPHRPVSQPSTRQTHVLGPRTVSWAVGLTATLLSPVVAVTAGSAFVATAPFSQEWAFALGAHLIVPMWVVLGCLVPLAGSGRRAIAWIAGPTLFFVVLARWGST
jgi:hypothetical protein